MKQTPRVLSVASGVLVLLISAAAAAPATITRNVNILAQPESGSEQVGYAIAGTVGDASQCNSNFCYFDQPSGADGWVSVNSLSTAAVPAPPAPQPQPQPPQPGRPGAGPGFSLDFNFGNRPPARPSRPRDLVCFYSSSNFRGDSFCAEPGDDANRMPRGWNDEISSIEVIGDAEVEVCTDTNFRGSCAIVDRDVSRLPSRYNDSISSYEVY